MIADLRQLLADLGDTPDAVADRLRALDIKGKPVSGDCCPIARYVIRHGFAWASVTHMSVMVNNPDREFAQHMEPCPKPVRSFIERFDHGAYRDLTEVAG
jgi:hypothetical protein